MKARLAVLCCVLLGCSTTTTTTTQVMVVVDADPGVRATTHDVHVLVRAGQGEISTWEDRYDTMLAADKAKAWPLELSLLPKNGDSTRVFEVVATALDQDGKAVAAVRAISGFVPHQALKLTLRFEDSCLGKAGLCTGTTTCHDGTCGDAHIDPGALKPYSPKPTGTLDGSIADGGASDSSLTSDGAVADQGLASAGDPCESTGARACSAHGSKLPLECNASQWQSSSPCDDTQRCDSAAGNEQGTCKPIVKECAGQTPGKTFCAGDAIRSCVDLVSFQDEKCKVNLTCSASGGVAHCVCKPGFLDDAGTCRDVNECATNNGGCDALTVCINTPGARTCGACPTGDLGDGVKGCTPALTDLTLSAGTLNPALSADVTDYNAQISLVTQTLTLTPTVPTGATVKINQQVVSSGKPWQSPVFNLGVNTVAIVVSQAGHPSHSYTLTVTRGEQEAYLKPSNTAIYERFGTSVSISGDTLVVGAFAENSNATGVNGNQADNSAGGSGAAYVFVRNGSTWSQQAYLKASNTDAGDYFGWSVSISGDTLVVGAFRESSNATGVNGNQTDNSATESGAAYVFVRSGSTWSQQAYLKASNTGTGDYFGWSVSISGEALVVGAFQESSVSTGVNGNQADNTALNSGADYVFVRSGSTWSQQAYLKASNTGAGDQFGYTVSISGDTLVVGAYGEDSNATGVGGNQADNSASTSGAAYAFVRSGSTWTQQAYLKASNTEASDAFGYSVSISGDTLVVGAYAESSNATGVNGNQTDNTATGSGAAYVFARSGSAWSQQAYLKASNTGASDQFGSRVSISGDALVVGAIGESSNATGVGGSQTNNNAGGSGAAYLFARSGGTWSQQAYLKASNAGASDQFGWSVSISGDTLVVGADYEKSSAIGVNGNQADDSLNESGAAYVFR